MSGVYNNSIFIIQLFILQIQACMLVFCTVLLDFDPMAKSEEELKSLLMKVKEENEKVSLKLNIWKTKIMVSGPITSWQIDGETVETVADFIFWAPKSLQMVIAAMKLINKWDLIKIKSFSTTKETISKVKDSLQNGRK